MEKCADVENLYSLKSKGSGRRRGRKKKKRRTRGRKKRQKKSRKRSERLYSDDEDDSRDGRRDTQKSVIMVAFEKHGIRVLYIIGANDGHWGSCA